MGGVFLSLYQVVSGSQSAAVGGSGQSAEKTEASAPSCGPTACSFISADTGGLNLVQVCAFVLRVKPITSQQQAPLGKGR